MYESFYGFSEKPFSLQPDPTFLFLGKRHSIAYTMLEYGILNDSPITVITGEIGTGKTTLVRHLLNQLDDNLTVGLITNTHKSFGDLMTWICLAFGLGHKNKDKPELYDAFIDFIIDEYAKGKKTVILVDEAQNMDRETLEELRVLSNINVDKSQLLQIVLVGQTELRNILRQPNLEQLAQRVAVDYHLSALEPTETDDYIMYRMETAGGSRDIFDPKARRFIHYHADGVPRLINNLCEMSLVYGYACDKKIIDAETVFEYVRDKIRNGGGLLSRRKRRKTIREVYPKLTEFHSLDDSA